MMRAWLVICASAVILAACAGQSKDITWAQMQTGYNAALSQMNDMRRPCVDIGPEDPGCLIDDSEYRLLNLLRREARANLDLYWETGSPDYLGTATRSLDGLLGAMRGAQ